MHAITVALILSCLKDSPTQVVTGGYEVGMAESPSIAMVVSTMLRCDLVSILFGDLT